MKKQARSKLILTMAAVLAAPTLLGSTIVLRLDPINYSAFPGGEYNAQLTGLVAGETPSQILAGYNALAKTVADGQTGFQTFCTDETEPFTPGKTYEVVRNDRVVAGGSNLFPPTVTPGADILSVGTTWLYSQFAQGTLGGYDYTLGAGRLASANDLQATLWYLEDETSVAPVNAFMTAVYGNFADPKLDASAGTDGVYALNVTLRDGTRRQDVLVYMAPDGGFTLVLLGIGLGGLSLFSRKLQVIG